MMRKVAEVENSEVNNEQEAVHNLIGPISVHSHQELHIRPNSKLFYVCETTELRAHESEKEPTLVCVISLASA